MLHKRQESILTAVLQRFLARMSVRPAIDSRKTTRKDYISILIQVPEAKFRTWLGKVEFLLRGYLHFSAGVPRTWMRKGREIDIKLQQCIHLRCMPAVSGGRDDIGHGPFLFASVAVLQSNRYMPSCSCECKETRRISIHAIEENLTIDS